MSAAVTVNRQIAYTPAQAAIASGRTRTRIFGAIKSAELIARKDGKATLIEHDELVRWIRALPIIEAKVSRPVGKGLETVAVGGSGVALEHGSGRPRQPAPRPSHVTRLNAKPSVMKR